MPKIGRSFPGGISVLALSSRPISFASSLSNPLHVFFLFRCLMVELPAVWGKKLSLCLLEAQCHTLSPDKVNTFQKGIGSAVEDGRIVLPKN